MLSTILLVEELIGPAEKHWGVLLMLDAALSLGIITYQEWVEAENYTRSIGCPFSTKGLTTKRPSDGHQGAEERSA